MSENIVVVGANSGIAEALCRLLAERGCRLILAGRNLDQLERQAADLRIRYRAEVAIESFEALDFCSHPSFVDRCVRHFARDVTGFIVCYGYLPIQEETQRDGVTLRKAIDTNFTSVACLLNAAAAYLETRKAGYLAAISSVAGDRGRQSNYAYGAAKAGLSSYLQGLRNRGHHAGFRVLTIKPGMVDTPMTAGIVKAGSPLVSSPARVAQDIDRALRNRRDVIYTPGYWYYIMSIICNIPERLFKRLRL
jgi:short-subunit dehydrogenase